MSTALKKIKPVIKKKNKFIFIKFLRYVKRYWFVYLLILPGVLHTFIFRYIPIYGITLAFKDYSARKGILGSPWVGFAHFTVMFQDAKFYQVVANTLLINVYNLVFGFTFVVFLALMLNEMRVPWLKRTVQTFVYLPNFVSWIVFAGLVITILEPTKTGVLNVIVSFITGKKSEANWLTKGQYFRAIVVISGIVKTAGFGTIIYLAALSSVNPEIIESAVIDGAHRGNVIWHVYLPRIAPTVAVLLILQFSRLFASNFDQVFNLYNPAVYEQGDVLSTYLYRSGLLEGKFEMGTALGLVFNVIGLALVILANKVISKMNVMGIF